MSLIGSLHDVKIADVLKLFASGRKTGLLMVARQSGAQALLRFQKGAIVHASAGRLQGDDAVIDLFGWKEGQLTFVPEERSVVPNVTLDVDALVVEGLRSGEKLHRMREVIPSEHSVFQWGTGPAQDGARMSVGSTEWRVLRLLDGVLDVREVIDASSVPKAEVMQVLLEWAEQGFLQRVEPQKTLRVQAQSLFGQAHGLFGKDAAEVDERLDGDWRRIRRFASGVLRIEIRTLTGRSVPIGVAFRPGLIRGVVLPRNLLAELALREGDEVAVRPIA